MKKHAVAFASMLILVAGAAFGRGMMGTRSSAGMPRPGMMGGWWDNTPPGAGTALTIGQAAEAVQKYLKDFWVPDLVLAEVMEFDN